MTKCYNWVASRFVELVMVIVVVAQVAVLRGVTSVGQ